MRCRLTVSKFSRVFINCRHDPPETFITIILKFSRIFLIFLLLFLYALNDTSIELWFISIICNAIFNHLANYLSPRLRSFKNVWFYVSWLENRWKRVLQIDSVNFCKVQDSILKCRSPTRWIIRDRSAWISTSKSEWN